MSSSPPLVLHLRSSRGLYGAEQVILTLAAACEAQGLHSVIASLVDRREPHRELLELAQARKLEAWALPSRGRFDLGSVAALIALQRRLQPAVVHSHGYKAQLLAWLASRVDPRPQVCTTHGDTGESRAVGLYEALGRGLLSQADAVVSVSPAGTQAARAAGAARVVEIPNAVDCAALQARVAAATSLRERLGWRDRPVVLAVGRLSPEKGHGLLIDALATLPEPRPGLLLAGDGPLAESLAARARAQDVPLRLLGFQRDLAPAWKAADLFCQPSLTEGLPMAVLEAMAVGLPVVATRVGALAAVLEAEGGPAAGHVLPPGDGAALRRALAELLAEEGRSARAALGRAGQRRVQVAYSAANLAARHLQEVYEPLLATPAPGGGIGPRDSAFERMSP